MGTVVAMHVHHMFISLVAGHHMTLNPACQSFNTYFYTTCAVILLPLVLIILKFSVPTKGLLAKKGRVRHFGI